MLFVFASTTLYAAEKYDLGMGNVALKIDYINFTEDAFDEIDLENGVYVGLEGYYAIYRRISISALKPAGQGQAMTMTSISVVGQSMLILM